MAEIILTLPELFYRKIHKQPLEPSTLDVLKTASEIVGDPTGGLPFFPEYTDHAMTHIQRVLDASASLLNDKARETVTPEDVHVLSAAIVLHDIAMHLSEDGFIQIVTAKWKSASTNWDKKWREFCEEAGRWDARTLINILGTVDGTATPSDLAIVANSAIPLDNPEVWTKQQRRLIGEFIRRHHATFAQEFALSGFPGSGEPIWIISNEHEYAELSGLVAQSHHLAPRDTLPILLDRYGSKVRPLKTHPVLLMAALRIADYLDVERARSPKMSLALREICNPFSRREWDAHLAITDVHIHDDDTEAVLVIAEPKDVGTYLRIRSLLDDIQRDLDTTWAVLGEVFSQKPGLESVGLAIRRITSNIDDDESFRKTVEFIPRRFRFHTAGARLLNKLVSPLYSDQVEVGVRELLQNAIDATKELEYLSSEPADPIRVSVETRGDKFLFEIEDFGIGMTEDVLHSYFLCAGESFRDSDPWKRNFQRASILQIARSGRFGIGTFAAFLLGDHIGVTTRYYEFPEHGALTFSASIDNEHIEVRKAERRSPGTTITIELSRDVYQRLCAHDGIEWDWYRWSSPRIERRIENNGELPKVMPVPQPGEDLPDEWHEMQVDRYDSVMWTHGKAAAVVCNGITIGSSASSYGYSRQLYWDETSPYDRPAPVFRPKVSVDDRFGEFPISLQRFETIRHELPFRDSLMADVTRDYIAFSLVFAPEAPPSPMRFGKRNHLYYPGLMRTPVAPIAFSGPWFYSSSGVGVQHAASLHGLSARTVVLLISLDSPSSLPPFPFRDGDFHFFGTASLERHPVRSLSWTLAQALGLLPEELTPHYHFYTTCRNASVFVEETLAEEYGQHVDNQIDLRIAKRTATEIDGVSVLFTGSEPISFLDSLPDKIQRRIAEGTLIAARIVEPGIPNPCDPVFSKVWAEYFEDQIIPYDLAERAEKFRRAYADLDTYVQKWRSIQAKGPHHLRDLFRRMEPNGTIPRL